MKLYALARDFAKRTPVRYLYHRIKGAIGARGQSDEAEILADLARHSPKTFVEFGFHPTQYNCAGLTDFNGLLIDGDPSTVKLARAILPARIEARHCFITLDNLSSLVPKAPGVISIDVDGNDYWFLEALLPLGPHVVSVEYNASFLDRSITVPYDPAFSRHSKHPSGWYHGASLTALTSLCARHGMKLVAVASAGANAFFVRNDDARPALDPASAYRENALRNRWSGTRARDQWETIKHLPFVTVS